MSQNNYFNKLKYGHNPSNVDYYKAIDWNSIEDEIDKEVWEKLVAQFWTDTRVPVSNDLDDWRKLTQAERDLIGKVFGGLTLLDTMQSEDGVNTIFRDARTQHEQSALSNIMFMECYTKDHKLLTHDGWKNISDITEDDTVLTYNKHSNTMEFQQVMSTSSHIPEKLIHIHNRNNKLDLKVSPGHRMYYEQLNGRTGKWESKVMKAEDFMFLPKTNIRRLRKVAPFINNGVNQLTPIEKLLIAYQADGNLQHTEQVKFKRYINGEHHLINSKFIVFEFGFSKPNKIKHLYDIIDEIDGAWINDKKAMSPGKGNKKPQVNLGVYIPINLLPDNLVDKNKRLNRWFDLESFTAGKAKDFINEVSYWDAHIDKYNAINYCSTVAENTDFIFAVGVLAGYAVSKSDRIDNRKESHKDSTIIRLSPTDINKFLTFQRIKCDIIEPERVYGVQVPNSFLVVKNGISTTISGNCMHAKSYSTIFSTLNTKSEIEAIFEWTNNNVYVQNKAKIVNNWYQNGNAYQKKAASVLLESFLFYSGFYTPLYYLGTNRMPNTAEIIKLILRDESVHGQYLGYKAQKHLADMSEEEAEELREWTYDLAWELYENEEKYTDMLYKEVGWEEDVKAFLRYNCNKALMNLGLDPLFTETAEDVNPIVMNGISTGTSNHDFFSQVGNGYLVGQAEPMNDDDYLIGLNK